jgi:ribosomal protein S12 methylthiotransferase
MKTKRAPKQKINVITLGCSKNIVDSETLMGQIAANGIAVEHESGKTDKEDTVIINTCGFIDNAKEESINTILAYSQLKQEGKVGKVLVTGCLSERYAPELSNEIKNIDGWYGTHHLKEMLQDIGAEYKHELLGERKLTTPTFTAYFKIAEGCNRPCSFCAIPLMRGTHVSKPIEDLISEAKKLASKGTKELVLIAQDLTYYGLDLYKERKLAYLLESLANVSGIEWIRLQYAYPSGFPLEIIEVMKKYPNICNYLDMPLQHISDAMLSSMRRGITKQKTIDLIQKIRDINPEIALRTTLISGYPGETQKDFDELYEFIEQTKFERLGVFNYSHEENTHAYALIDNVPDAIKQERADALMELQQGISWELNQNKIGKTYKVLIERVEGEHYIGRTEFDSPEVDNEVLISNKEHLLLPGKFYPIRITGAEEYDLKGVLND